MVWMVWLITVKLYNGFILSLHPRFVYLWTPPPMKPPFFFMNSLSPSWTSLPIHEVASFINPPIVVHVGLFSHKVPSYYSWCLTLLQWSPLAPWSCPSKRSPLPFSWNPSFSIKPPWNFMYPKYILRTEQQLSRITKWW